MRLASFNSTEIPPVGVNPLARIPSPQGGDVPAMRGCDARHNAVGLPTRTLC
jgi:hypothetical protein